MYLFEKETVERKRGAVEPMRKWESVEMNREMGRAAFSVVLLIFKIVVCTVP